MNALEARIAALGTVCASLPDRRKGPLPAGAYTMADIGLSAFSLFFMGSPSFLAYQRTLAEGQGRSNCQTLFGISAIPSDNYIRQMLDGAPTAAFDPLFMKAIETPGVLAPFQRLGGRSLVALDGTARGPLAGETHLAQDAPADEEAGEANGDVHNEYPAPAHLYEQAAQRRARGGGDPADGGPDADGDVTLLGWELRQ